MLGFAPRSRVALPPRGLRLGGFAASERVPCGTVALRCAEARAWDSAFPQCALLKALSAPPRPSIFEGGDDFLLAEARAGKQKKNPKHLRAWSLSLCQLAPTD